MDEKESWARQFEENRGHLRAVAYRMLGSLSEADDAVQEAWLRLSRSDAAAIENLGGWLTTVVARVCLDILRSRASRRAETLEAQKFEPPAKRQGASDPEQEVLLADSVGLALLVVLDRLTPAERIAFVLHDMFAVSFDEIASIIGRSPTAARQLASRATAVCRERTGFPPPIFPNNEKSSALSLLLCVPVISRVSSPFSIRMSWSALTALLCLQARQQKSAVPGLGPRARSPSPSLCVPHHRCWSMARWDSYGPQVAGCRECSASRSRAGRSSKSK
jgi:RNA polymerase sigma factor (sigma-70 family)